MKAESVAELIAAEAKQAREAMIAANPSDAMAFLRTWFVRAATQHPEFHTIANRASFMRLATASTQGES